MSHTFQFGHGDFFGTTKKSHHVPGITLSHRIASGEVETHTHADGHFIWVTGGRYVTSARGEAVSSSGEFIYTPPGVEHRDHFAGGRGSFFAISIHADRLSEWSQVIAPPDHAQRIAHPSVLGAAWELMRECRQTPDSALLMEALCVHIFARLGDWKNAKKPPPWLTRAREVLSDCAAGDLTLGDVAQTVGVHPIHFTRSFRAHFGCTPGEFLRVRRLERAAALLQGSALSLPEVALEVGFADQSHFTRKFSAMFGVAPGEFRRLTV